MGLHGQWIFIHFTGDFFHRERGLFHGGRTIRDIGRLRAICGGAQ